MHLENLLDLRARYAPASVESIRDIADKFTSEPNFLLGHDFLSPYTSILVGQVQSGKTGHYLGIAAAVADAETRFPVFILLTQNLVSLQQQTFLEAKRLLTTFDVFDEGDELSFRHSLQYSKPKMIVLKKSKSPLTKWAQILDPSLLSGQSLFIIDDEADATGLNTQVNVPDQSEINRLIDLLILQNNSFLLQVTATPQAIFLQNFNSNFRPQSHIYFSPGPDYLGGKFFYPSDGTQARLTPYIFKATDVGELAELQDPYEMNLPRGLADAIRSFILTAAYRIGIERDSQCNFLLHPSTSTFDHDLIRDKVKRFILDTINTAGTAEAMSEFQFVYADLKSTKPQLPTLEVLLREAQRTPFTTSVMNSSPENTSRTLPNIGANLFIGGNVLSRGIVIPKLQTIYYCRTAKRLTVDTYWQHSRAFGYDRDPALIRLFMPPTMYANFIQMSESIIELFDSLNGSSSENVLVVTPHGMSPTRKSVVEDLASNCITGGTNHFPVNPVQQDPGILDSLLSSFDGTLDYLVVDSEFAVDLLSETRNIELGDIDLAVFQDSIRSLSRDGKVVLVVRRDRDISANTGTLLSPDDRKLSQSFINDSVLILYRLRGDASKGWGGNPFWIPNVKLPGNKLIYFRT